MTTSSINASTVTKWEDSTVTTSNVKMESNRPLWSDANKWAKQISWSTTASSIPGLNLRNIGKIRTLEVGFLTMLRSITMPISWDSSRLGLLQALFIATNMESSMLITRKLIIKRHSKVYHQFIISSQLINQDQCQGPRGIIYLQVWGKQSRK